MADLLEIYKTVRDELNQLGNPWEHPPHLVWRLAAAVGEEAVRHVDSDLVQVASRTHAGTVFVFTDSRVVWATMDNGPAQPSPNEATYSVTLSTWRRADLQRLELLPDRDEWRNSDAGWSGWANTESSGWPAGLAVTLHYNDREAITLPLRTELYQGIRMGMLFEFLPALLRDVSTP